MGRLRRTNWRLAVIVIAGLAIWTIRTWRVAQGQPPRTHPITANTDSEAHPVDGAPLGLNGTEPLSLPLPWDLLEQQRQEIIHYFLNQISTTPAKRDQLWHPDFSSPRSYAESVQLHRNHLRQMLGLIQAKPVTPDIKVLQQSAALRIEDVTIPIDSEFRARALVFLPLSSAPTAAVIAIPPANESREEYLGLVERMAPAEWLTALLAHKVVVAIPLTVERTDDHRICQEAGGRDRRTVLWRAGFIVGRTLVGLEVQQALAVRAFLSSKTEIDPKRIAVLGERQGGMTALYAGAVDDRFAAVAAVEYFQQREDCWQEPVDRVLYGQLNEFGDAEVAALIAPRPLLTATTPGGLASLSKARAEAARARRFYQGLGATEHFTTMEVADSVMRVTALKLSTLLPGDSTERPLELRFRFSPEEVNKRRNEHFEELYSYLHALDEDSEQVRKKYWQLESTPPQDRKQKIAEIRASLAELVGVIPSDKAPLHPRTAFIGETDKFLAFEVLLDALPGVHAYGQLLVPRAAAGSMHDALPVVICQHGFGGAPKYVTGVGSELESNDDFYHRFGERLAERGYVVFAPYLTVPVDTTPPNIVHRADLINPLVRLAASLGMLRTSIELAKLHRAVDFLQSLPFVNPDRIGYYGLSYGGYSAMWMPPLEPRLKFTIISAHFNDWGLMLTDPTRLGASYWTLPDDDFHNWNVLNRFTHTELIAAMWPRPVCIEWGLNDPVTTPAWHERAWKDVEKFRDAWNMEDRIVDNDFIGPHTIHGIQTFFFIDRWLRPERSAGRDYGCRDNDCCLETLSPDFHGYAESSTKIVPYVTQLLDSRDDSVIRGEFYVSDRSPAFTGMAIKLARVGNPGNLTATFGSRPGSDDIGVASIQTSAVYPGRDLWYEATLPAPARLDPKRIYFFEISSSSGKAPSDCYRVFGPKPLGGEDYPANFGLSFRALTKEGE
ncbi:MAG: prolyl oligopeptidase family serine peptidase [Acidobacteriia bacterium]|nr:prolyl oligopeptidase family serine peptidase [Terriglobia bacterium]